MQATEQRVAASTLPGQDVARPCGHNAAVTEGLLLIGSLLASLTAFAAFLLGVTKTARLRRREQTLREAMAVFDTTGPHRAMLTNLHKAVVAELVGRQMTPVWRVLWPWIAWLAVLLFSAQAGYTTAQYLHGDAKVTWTGVATAVLGDPFVAPIAVFMVPSVLYWIFVSQVYTLIGRAEATRQFYDGEQAGRPETFAQASAKDEFASRVTAQEPRPRLTPREWGKGLVKTLRALGATIAPGLFVVFMGLFMGLNVWRRRVSNFPGDLGDVQPLLLVTILGVSALGPLTLMVLSEVRLGLLDYALPDAHRPESKLVLPDRLRAGQGLPPRAR